MAQRKRLLINISLQSDFILTVFLVCLLIVLVNLANGYVLFSHFLGTSVPAGDLETAKKIIGEVISQSRGRLAILALVNLAIVFFIGLFMSHRFAGPAFKMEREMRQVQEGDLTARVHLRDGDQLTELAGGFNRMAEGLVELQSEVDGAGRVLIAEVRGAAGLPQKTLDAAGRLENALERFTLPGKEA